MIDSKSAVYEIANFIQGIEQLTVTTLRNVIGSLDLEQALTSRDQINGQLRGVLDEATGKWGIRVNRVELKAIDPPHSVQDSMEKQMRAERDRRAAILTAEGVKQSAILTAEGEKQSQILRAEGSAQARILEAQGQARAITQVFEAIHRGNPDQKLLAYQYLQVLPQIARGDSNKMWIVPSELTEALKGIGSALGGTGQGGPGRRTRTRGSTPGRPCRPRSTTPCWRTRPGRWPRRARRRHAPAPRPRATRPGSPAAVDAPRARGAADDGLTAPQGPLADPRAPPAPVPPVPPTDLPMDGPVREDPRGRRADSTLPLQDTRSPSLGWPGVCRRGPRPAGSPACSPAPSTRSSAPAP